MSIRHHVGERIRSYRKMQGLTLQDLADRIHKSRATVSKYENGEIIIDIDTLYDISQALHTDISNLTDYRPTPFPGFSIARKHLNNTSPFSKAGQLYVYFYDDLSKRLKGGVIDIKEDETQPGGFSAQLTLATIFEGGQSSDTYYTGSVTYSDMLIRFSFINQFNSVEEALLYVFNPLDVTEDTTGMISGISSIDLAPCAMKCLVSLAPHFPDDELIRSLLIGRKEWQQCQKRNMLTVSHESSR